MRVRVLGWVGVCVAGLLVSAAVDTAEARRGGGHSSGGGHFRGFSAPRVHAHVAPQFHAYVPMHPRRLHRNYFATGPRVVSDRCAWLRHRALATGSRLWWQRYHACRNGFPF